MDTTGLQQLFSQGNPFLAEMGEQAFNTDQATKQQTLADLVQKNSQSAQTFPLAQQQAQANIGHTNALARQSNVTSDATQNATDSKPLPVDVRAAAMSKLHAGMSEDQRGIEDSAMYKRLQYASMAKANGGVLPLNISSTLSPEEQQYFASPQAIDATIAMGKSYHDTHPKTIDAREKEANNLKRTNIMADAQRYRADQMFSGVKARVAGGGKNSAPKNMTSDQAMNYYRNQARMTRDQGGAGSEEAAQQLESYADQAELVKLRAVAAGAAARDEGKVDISRLPGNPITVRTAPPLAPTGRGGAPKPGSSPDNPIILR